MRCALLNASRVYKSKCALSHILWDVEVGAGWSSGFWRPDPRRNWKRRRDLSLHHSSALPSFPFLFFSSDKAVKEALARLLVYNRSIKKKTKWKELYDELVSKTLSSKQLDGEMQLLKMTRSERGLDVLTRQAINPLLKNNSSRFLHEHFFIRLVPLYDLVPGVAGSVKICDILYGSTPMPI